MSKAPLLDETSFQAVLSAPTALVDFTAAWCGPCRALAPHIDALASELEGDVLVAKVDVDASPSLAERYGVTAMPTLLVFRNGRVVDTIVGAAPKHVLKARLAAVPGAGASADAPVAAGAA